MESAGTVAAPLLAGFSFTLLVLLLPTLEGKRTTVRAGADVRVVSESQDVSALPELAAISLLLAGLLLIASVQAAISMRFHSHSPGELQEWFPEYFPESEDPAVAPATEDLPPGWDDGEAQPTNVGKQWFGGWPREYLSGQLREASRWGRWARRLYHGGVLALLIGLVFLVAPPGDDGTCGRWVLFGVAVLGALGEFIWILTFTNWEKLRARILSLRKPQQGEGPN